ncbi:Rrp15p-domain-containing protein [Schizophyllum commune]
MPSSPQPAQKRRKLTEDTEVALSASEGEEGYEALSNSGGSDADSGTDEPDTADEIEDIKRQKSRQTSKRKIRATGPAAFGATLQSLLDTETPSTLPLSLKPSVARKKNDEKLEQRAKKALLFERKEKEDKNHISDVIGGWGAEGERALRKVAQRGVVKLFNAIQQAQAQSEAVTEQKKAQRGTGKQTLAAPAEPIPAKGKTKAKNKDNIIGRGKDAAVEKDKFFDLIRSGGTVSKA